MAPDMNPPPAAPQFLIDAGWEGAEIRPLAGDASFRRYFRVVHHDRSAILMDAPPPHEDPRPFIAVAEWLTERNFAAPGILHRDLSEGLVLLQDFGDARMRETVDAAPESELRLYEAAVDLLIRLAEHEAAPVRDYDLAEYHREAGLLTEWYTSALGLEVDGESYAEAWDAVLAPVTGGYRPVTVLRDYHAENIMLIDGGSETLGLLDFQDALSGHPAYDLVSLLQDARRDVPAELETAMLDRYKRITGAGDAFDVAYHVLGAQRNAKIIGIFTRLWKRDGKPRYPGLLPRVWRYLERDLKHPALKPVADWFDANVPAEMRGDPMAILSQ
jgi:aminoglycoside/choline kinase family phosphotransferase